MKNQKHFFTILFALLLFSFPGVSQNNFLDFDGTDDRVECSPAPITGAAARTVEFWARVEGGYGAAISFGSVSNSQLFDIYLSPAGSVNLSGYFVDYATGFIPGTDWHHYAFVYDGTTMFCFVDGAPAPTASKAMALNTGGGNLFLGVRNNGSGNHFDGQLDELRFWNFTRSQADIQATMTSELSGSESGLVAYYNFNQGTCAGDNSGLSAPQLTDLVAGNNGTLVNFDLDTTGDGDGCTSNFACDLSPCTYPPSPIIVPVIPTMGEWALIIFGLIILSLGVVYVIKWKGDSAAHAYAHN